MYRAGGTGSSLLIWLRARTHGAGGGPLSSRVGSAGGMRFWQACFEKLHPGQKGLLQSQGFVKTNMC